MCQALKKGATEECQSSDDNKRAFKWCVGKTKPMDSPDAIVTVATQNKNQGPHSDTKYKFCNHDDLISHLHSMTMRIVTHAFVYPMDGKDIHPDKMCCFLNHQLQNGSKCEIVGCFCSTKKAFVKLSVSKWPGIPFHQCHHLHIQWVGSQGELQHAVVSATRDYKRVTCSCRCLQPVQKTTKVQQKRILQHIQNPNNMNRS